MRCEGFNAGHGNLATCWLDEHTSVHWVNENSCLLEVKCLSADKNQDLMQANQIVQKYAAALSSELPHWLENYVPAYTSLLIVHDLLVSDKFLVLNWLLKAEAAIKHSDTDESLTVLKNNGVQAPSQSHHTIEVCYSPNLSGAFRERVPRAVDMPNDLEAVSAHTRLDLEDIIKLHTQQQYRVFTVGFLPNFAYMGLTHQALTIPRLQNPRKRVPAGAVAIADNQTAIYPQSSPGGWHILGYTPIDLGICGELMFEAGDTVSFKAITEKRFCDQYALRKAVDACD